MVKIAAVDRTVPVVALIYMSDIRSGQSALACCGVREGGGMLVCGEWGEWGVGGNENNCGLEIAGSRLSVNRRDPLAGFRAVPNELKKNTIRDFSACQKITIRDFSVLTKKAKKRRVS